LGFGLGPTVTRTKQTAVQLSLGLTVWVELSLGLNVGGLNIKTPGLGGNGSHTLPYHVAGNGRSTRHSRRVITLRPGTLLEIF
jgi:hypothetical protein